MSWTKEQIIVAALTEIGIASYDMDIGADEKTTALARLDAMMADWNAKGIRLGYPLAANQENSDMNDDSGLPDSAYEAVINNLACRLAPSYGKPVQRETKVAAKIGYNTLVMRSGVLDPMEKEWPTTLPKGQGNKTYRNESGNFFGERQVQVDAGPDSILGLK